MGGGGHGESQREVQILGECRVVAVDDEGRPTEDPIPLSRMQQTVLCRLALAAPHAVTGSELTEAVWDGSAPANAKAALQNQISRIRARAGTDSIRTAGTGYALGLPTDVQIAERELVVAEAALADGDAPAAFDGSQRALGRWRGPAAPELDGGASPDRQWINELRHSLENVRLSAAIASGRTAWAVVEADRLVTAAPHDERRWAMQMRALDGAGRRGEALGVFDRARRVLGDELGLGVGTVLRQAEAEILRADPDAVLARRTNFVGRRDLLDVVLERGRSSGIAVLTGEAGIGKSTLLHEAAMRLRREQLVVVRTTCSAHADSAVRTLLELLDGLGADTDASLPPVPGFVDALARRSEQDRIVLVVDDLDQAGPTSLGGLQQASELAGVALLAAAKDPELCGPPLAPHAVTVEPLTTDEITEVVVTALGPSVPDVAARVEWLAGMSGGNPLLLEYLLSDSELRAAWAAGDPGGIESPHSAALRELVRRRLERVGSTTRATLDIAAVCGATFPAPLLQALAPEAGISGALASQLLVEHTSASGEPMLGFRHGALQRIVYLDVAPGQRIEIHDQAATVLEAEGAAPEAIAVHGLAAVELDPLSASDRALRAASAASEQGAHAEAAQWCARAADAAAATPGGGDIRRVRALVRGADSLRQAGDPDQEAALFDAAGEAIALGDPELIGDAAFALLQLGATTETGSLHERAIEVANVALEVVTDTEQWAQVASAASLTHSMTGHPELCRDLFVRAERTARTEATRRHVLPFGYLALGHPADLEERERITAELLALGEEANDAQAMFEGEQLAFSNALQRADGERVRRAVERSIELVDRVGDVGRRWSTVYQRAAVAHLDDELDLSEQLSEEALVVFSDVSPSRAFAVYGAQLLVIRHAQGRVAELAEPLEGLLADQPGVPAWNAALALALVADDPDRARTLAAAALEQAPPDFTWLATHVIGGQAAALLGDDATIPAYRERLTPWSGLVCWQGTCAYGPVDLPLTMLARAAGDEVATKRHANAAARQIRSLRAPVFERQLAAAT